MALDILPFLTGPVLDFGCGVGFLTLALQELGVDVCGYDISPWAVQYGREMGARVTDRMPSGYKTLIALDVFEHMSPADIPLGAQRMIVRVPVCQGGDFVLEASRRDNTHVTRLTKGGWGRLLRDYDCTWLFGGERIWESEGVLSRVYERRRGAGPVPE